MASFAAKTLFVTALVCLVFDLATSEQQKNAQKDAKQLESAGYETGVGYETEAGGHEAAADHADGTSTTAAPGTFKDKLKGIVKNVKKGASDAYESVSSSVSGAFDKIKGSFNRDSDKHSSAEHAHHHSSTETSSSEERHH